MSEAVRQLPVAATVDEAIELAWARVMSGEYRHVAASIADLWDTLRMSRSDLTFLAQEGLIALATLRQREIRASGSQRPAIGWGTPHGKKKWDAYVALTWPYQGADATKPLLEFDDSDLAAFAVRNAMLSDAYQRRATWATETAATLNANQVLRVRDLPEAVLAEVAAAASEAMGRQA